MSSATIIIVMLSAVMIDRLLATISCYFLSRAVSIYAPCSLLVCIRHRGGCVLRCRRQNLKGREAKALKDSHLPASAVGVGGWMEVSTEFRL